MNFLRRRFQNLAIKKNKVYVLPTRQGYFFFMSIIIIFFMGLVYGNNMCFLLAFLMVGQFVIALFQSHNNIKNYKIDDIKFSDVHVGENLKVDLISQNDFFPEELVLKINDDENWAIHFLEKNFFANSFHERGKMSFSFISYESTYPYNLFRTWRYLKKDTTFYLYPKLMEEQRIQEDEFALSNQGMFEMDADFQELRPYVKGESFRRIDWKKYAMTDRLFWKKFTSRAEEKIQLIFEEIDLKIEERISLVATIIHQADKNQKDWEVYIKDDNYHSPHDYQKLMRELSEYQG